MANDAFEWDPFEWVPMTFDPELQVNVRGTIMVMRGEVATLTRDDWLDVKEQTADMLEQFIALRRRVKALEADLAKAARLPEQ